MYRYSGLVFLLLLSFCAHSQDLIVTSYSGQTSFDRYEEFSEIFTIKNDGIVAVTGTSYTHRVYLSADAVLGSNDLLVGAVYGASLNAGQTANLLFGSGACDITPGVYNLIVKLDYFGEITETDETNNLYSIPNVVINPPDIDWKFTSLTVTSPLHVNGTLPMNLQIENTGSTNTNVPLYTSFYLSKDALYGGGDTFIGELRSWTEDTDVITEGSWWRDQIIPSTLQPGEYFLIAITDVEGDFIETDESNNTFVTGAIMLEPGDIDLSITQFHFAESDISSIRAGYQVGNYGTTSVSGYSINAYASFDQTLDPWDDFLLNPSGFVENRVLEPNDNEFANLIQPYPYSLTPGNYYLILVINENQSVIETNYNNNIIVSPEASIFVFPPAVPAITITNAAFTGEYDNTDTNMTLNLSFINSGDPATPPNNVIYYDIVIKDNGGNIVFTEEERQIFYINTGESVSSTWPITLTHGLPTGEYTAEISSSSPWNSTPLFQVPLSINVPAFEVSGIIQGEDGTPITAGKLFLYQKDDNGKVSFINKTVLTSDNHFSFLADSHEHTLYFIPDRASFPQYIPTILGKTAVLKPSCFFTLTDDMDIVFDILKIQPMVAGPMSISGNVYSGSSSPQGRMKTANAASRISQLTGESVEGFPVILFSEEGNPVSITTTDSNGYYEFTNLPKDTYQVIVAFELNQPLMEQPVPVNVTQTNAVVNFDITADNVMPVTLLGQQIIFNSSLTFSYGSTVPADFVTTNSGLPVTLTSSNTQVAAIVDGKIVINGAGKTIITASQEGNESYLPALLTKRELVVNKASQSITLTELPEVAFGDLDFPISASANTGLPVKITSSNEAVARVDNGYIVINGAGKTILKAVQAGNGNYNQAEEIRTLTVRKGDQQITFADLPDEAIGEESFILNATSSSRLAVSFHSDNESIAAINGNKLIIKKPGVVNISATQNGNGNYNPASIVTQQLTVSVVSGIESTLSGLKVYPNPVRDVITIESMHPVTKVGITDALGKSQHNFTWQNHSVNAGDLTTGIYFMKIETSQGYKIFRIFKQ